MALLSAQAGIQIAQIRRNEADHHPAHSRLTSGISHKLAAYIIGKSILKSGTYYRKLLRGPLQLATAQRETAINRRQPCCKR
jgi:hypothetical protein